MSRVFFHVQHLLGIGHIRRAAVLARTLAAGGFDVLLVSGGAPLKLDLGRARFHQLPPVRARDESLRELSRLDGRPLDEAFKSERVRALLELFHAEKPDVLIAEQFPFGRTQLRFELLPLLQAAQERRPRPLIVSSVRDVVRRSVSPRRVQETLDLLKSFDTVLIHGDPKVIGFERSFAAWDAIRDRAAYTGYVADPVRVDGAAGKDEVIVSVGGGAVGAPLIEAATVARGKTALAGRLWRLLGGGGETRTINGMAVEPARSDFPTLLRNATLSISQAGYNTVVETLACADRAVLVPFGTARETEQTDRASWLAERGLVTCLPAGTLTSDTLAAAVNRALQGPSIRSFPPCDLNGAATTVALLHQRLA
ncbi:MAG: glycosyl transferase [Proteobacteria bacterium]|nr:glycosyl transferase [Pseudomonadota bacterium]